MGLSFHVNIFHKVSQHDGEGGGFIDNESNSDIDFTWVTVSGSTPRSNRALAMSFWSFLEAMCKGVKPFWKINSQLSMDHL